MNPLAYDGLEAERQPALPGAQSQPSQIRPAYSKEARPKRHHSGGRNSIPFSTAVAAHGGHSGRVHSADEPLSPLSSNTEVDGAAHAMALRSPHLRLTAAAGGGGGGGGAAAAAALTGGSSTFAHRPSTRSGDDEPLDVNTSSASSSTTTPQWRRHNPYCTVSTAASSTVHGGSEDVGCGPLPLHHRATASGSSTNTGSGSGSVSGGGGGGGGVGIGTAPAPLQLNVVLHPHGARSSGANLSSSDAALRPCPRAGQVPLTLVSPTTSQQRQMPSRTSSSGSHESVRYGGTAPHRNSMSTGLLPEVDVVEGSASSSGVFLMHNYQFRLSTSGPCGGAASSVATSHSYAAGDHFFEEMGGFAVDDDEAAAVANAAAVAASGVAAGGLGGGYDSRRRSNGLPMTPNELLHRQRSSGSGVNGGFDVIPLGAPLSPNLQRPEQSRAPVSLPLFSSLGRYASTSLSETSVRGHAATESDYAFAHDEPQPCEPMRGAGPDGGVGGRVWGPLTNGAPMHHTQQQPHHQHQHQQQQQMQMQQDACAPSAYPAPAGASHRYSTQFNPGAPTMNYGPQATMLPQLHRMSNTQQSHPWPNSSPGPAAMAGPTEVESIMSMPTYVDAALGSPAESETPPQHQTVFPTKQPQPQPHPPRQQQHPQQQQHAAPPQNQRRRYSSSSSAPPHTIGSAATPHFTSDELTQLLDAHLARMQGAGSVSHPSSTTTTTAGGDVDEVWCPAGSHFSVYDSDMRQHYLIDSDQVAITRGAIKYVSLYERYGNQTRFRFQLCNRHLHHRCANGTECQYIHSLVVSTATQVHMNENNITTSGVRQMNREELAGGRNTLHYATMSPGMLFAVYPPNQLNSPPQLIPSELILQTEGAVQTFHALGGDAALRGAVGRGGGGGGERSIVRPRHCAHFQFKRMCNLGSSCHFIHSLIPFVQGMVNQPPLPPNVDFAAVGAGSAGLVLPQGGAITGAPPVPTAPAHPHAHPLATPRMPPAAAAAAWGPAMEAAGAAQDAHHASAMYATAPPVSMTPREGHGAPRYADPANAASLPSSAASGATLYNGWVGSGGGGSAPGSGMPLAAPQHPQQQQQQPQRGQGVVAGVAGAPSLLVAGVPPAMMRQPLTLPQQQASLARQYAPVQQQQQLAYMPMQQQQQQQQHAQPQAGQPWSGAAAVYPGDAVATHMPRGRP